MARRLWANNARCALGSNITTTGAVATITLETGKGALFPSPSAGNWFILSIEDETKNVECFKITSRSGDICTVSGSGADRAQEGTTARTFTAATSVCGVRPTKAAFEAIDDHIEDTTAAHAATAISSTGAHADVQSFLTALAASVTALTGALTAPSGTRMVFQQTTAPTGWTKDTAHNNKAMRVVSGSVTSGGATAFTSVFGSGKNTGAYALQIADIPSHNHGGATGIESADHAHLYISPISGPGGIDYQGGGGAPAAAWTGGVSANHTHAVFAEGGGGTHLHSLSLDLQYLDFIVAAKD